MMRIRNVIALAAVVLSVNACSNSDTRGAPMVESGTFGKLPDGREVGMHVLTVPGGMSAKVIDYGATLTDLKVRGPDGEATSVVLGFDTLEEYMRSNYFLGAVVGRVANRIANGKFTLDGKEYSLAVNRPPNHLHGGNRGFDKVVWTAEPMPPNDSTAAVKFSYTSVDGEEGYPGTVQVTVLYSLSRYNELRIVYTATTDKPTPVNLTNHSFFNLAGKGNILDHVLSINAERYTPVNSTLVPTGELVSVEGTSLDFRTPRKIGERIESFRSFANGYDHNFVLNGAGTFRRVARVEEPISGRVMEVTTTEPGLQLFTGNRFDGSVKGHGEKMLVQHAGFCLETQHFPDSVNQPDFPSVILRPGATFRSTTVYSFSTVDRHE